MAKLYYEDVEVGAEITPLVKQPTTRQLVRWAGASGDFNEFHYDKDVAQSAGLPGVIVHGLLKFQFLIQMLTDWIGVDGTLQKVSCRYRGMDFPGDTITCKGTVVNKFVDGDRHCLECEITLENQRGEQTTPGRAIVAVPSRG
ncbi:MAG: dehydratase [Dehalococcoidia bacterium]|nr:dehydratase [Dehalococcoidia bacterium]